MKMGPISNEVFSHDAEKYVYQKDIPVIIHEQPPVKPFKITSPDKSKKSKKDLEKEKQQKKKTRPYDLLSGQ